MRLRNTLAKGGVATGFLQAQVDVLRDFRSAGLALPRS